MSWPTGAPVAWSSCSGRPSDTAFNRRLMAMLERSSATPAAIKSYFEWALQQDIQEVLRAIHAPTRVLCAPGLAVPETAVRHVAELIPHSTFHVMPPNPPGTSIGQIALPMTDHVEEVATGTPQPTDVDRFLGTVLFTDVVSSTELLERVGDAAYRQMRADHERMVRLAVENAGGRLMTVTGDGTLSVFDSPTKAVRAQRRSVGRRGRRHHGTSRNPHRRARARRDERHRHDGPHRCSRRRGRRTWPGARVADRP